MNLFPVLPTILISRIIGVLVCLPAPACLWQCVLRLYCRAYRVNLDEAEFPLEHYRNLAEFFVRNLKPGRRPIGEGIVSPVDGTLRNFGIVNQPRLPQIKGKTYSLEDLLGDSDLAAEFKRGTFFNLYLSPRDYHQVHSPITGSIRRIIYRPGRLLPVNDLSMSQVENVFGTNERVTLVIEDAQGRRVAVSLIGALNVGKISLSCLPEVSRRIRARYFSGLGFSEEFDTGRIVVSAGDALGAFHLGSSVALLLPPGMLPLDGVVDQARPVCMGVSLSDLPEFRR